MSESIWTTRLVPHSEAKEIAQRLINSHFHQEPCARVGIPARPNYDDDLLILAYIEQQESALKAERARAVELAEALKAFGDCARSAAKRYELVDSSWFADMPGAWPITVEVTMAQLRRAASLTGAGDIAGFGG